MDERPKWTPEQLEALESLRRGVDVEDDSALIPVDEAVRTDQELAERLELIHRWDASISEAIRDVSVPPALAEQILQRLEPASIPSSRATLPHNARKRKRTRWAAIAAAVAVAASLIACLVVLNRLPELDPNVLRDAAREQFLADLGSQPSGTPFNGRDFPAEYPYSEDLRDDFPGIQWRVIPSFGPTKAIAYDIPLGPGRRATLYVVRCRSRSLPMKPPTILDSQTRNLATAAWQSSGVVYVVVVQGGEREYRSLLRTAGPLT